MGRGETNRSAIAPRGGDTARRVRVGLVAIAMLSLSGVLLAATATRPVATLDRPATLHAEVAPLPAPLPIESLPTLFDLDLSAPPAARVDVARRPTPPALPPGADEEPLQLIDPAAPPAPVVEDQIAPGASPPPAPAVTLDVPAVETGEKNRTPLQWLPGGSVRRSPTANENAQPEPSPAEIARSFLLPLKQDTQAKPLESPLQEKGARQDDDPPPTVREVITHPKKSPPRVETPPPRPLKPLTRNQIYLRNRLRKVLSYYYRRPLNSRDHDAWEAMHGMLAYELQSRIRAGGPQGEPMTAIGWLCYNNPCKQKQLMRLNERGEIRAQYGVGLQGHMGQFLAMLAQCNVDRNYPIRVDGREFTIQDLIASEQQTCYPDTELTFKLIGLMHYLPSDSQWVNERGESWSIERLIQEELEQPIRGSACGGTHRLAGLSLAARKRELRGEPLDGVFLQARKFTNQYEQYAYRLQNSDGSFSTEWFRGAGRERDINRRCRTSGHLLEWLLYHVPDERLESPPVVRGVQYLTNLLYQNSSHEWEVGPVSHALHALVLYNERMFKPYDEAAEVARGSSGARPSAAAPSSGRTDRSASRSGGRPSSSSSRN